MPIGVESRYILSMQKHLVVTVVGSDRPGLVDTVAGAIAGHDGSWLESRMCRLGGDFAGILRLKLPAEREGALRDAFRALESQGVKITMHAETRVPEAGPLRRALLEVVGQDRPGIVKQLSGELARHGVNVEELQTECVSAPMSGENLFRARMVVAVPDLCELSVLGRNLERIAADLLMELVFQETEGSPT